MMIQAQYGSCELSAISLIAAYEIETDLRERSLLAVFYGFTVTEIMLCLR